MKVDKEKKDILKNPPKKITGWVERTCSYGNKTVTKGKKYKVINYFRYFNHKYLMWDEFITIKNDNGWTVKMNLIGFKPCESH
jgi:hypothetical protein